MSTWSLTYQQSVSLFKRYHGDKHFSEFYLQDGGKSQLAKVWNKITSLSPYVFDNVSVPLPASSRSRRSARWRSWRAQSSRLPAAGTARWFRQRRLVPPLPWCCQTTHGTGSASPGLCPADREPLKYSSVGFLRYTDRQTDRHAYRLLRWCCQTTHNTGLASPTSARIAPPASLIGASESRRLAGMCGINRVGQKSKLLYCDRYFIS